MRDIPGFEGRYSATKDGRIWSHISNQFLKPYKCASGYLQVGLMKPQSKFIRKRDVDTVLVHRLIASTYLSLDLYDTKSHVDHINGIKDDNQVENLRLVTATGNMHALYGRLGVDTHSNKLCIKCNVIKSREVFIKISRSSDGLGPHCKDCERIYQAKSKLRRLNL